MRDDRDRLHPTFAQEPWYLPPNPGIGHGVCYETYQASGKRLVGSIYDDPIVIKFKNDERTAWADYAEHFVEGLLGIVHVHQHAFCPVNIKTLWREVEMLGISNLIRERRGQPRRTPPRFGDEGLALVKSHDTPGGSNQGRQSEGAMADTAPDI
jgi:hypothetical protein